MTSAVTIESKEEERKTGCEQHTLCEACVRVCSGEQKYPDKITRSKYVNNSYQAHTEKTPLPTSLFQNTTEDVTHVGNRQKKKNRVERSCLSQTTIIRHDGRGPVAPGQVLFTLTGLRLNAAPQGEPQ